MPTLSIEEWKQYLLGYVVYLVGGGMRTCHEAFTTGSFLDIPLHARQILGDSPGRFPHSKEMHPWQEKFWDLVGW